MYRVQIGQDRGARVGRLLLGQRLKGVDGASRDP